jgi:heptosyltransferase-2
VTAEESLDLLEHNPMVDSLIGLRGAGLARLQVEGFDLVINPEAAKESSALATLVGGEEKKGFGLSARGFVVPFNEGAEEIFHMGLFDDVKKRNQKTYEELICQLAELPYERVPPMLHLTDDEVGFAEAFGRREGVEKGKPVVGIKRGGGGRWRFKRWTVKGFIGLAKELSGRLGAQILLLGGPAEAETNRDILYHLGGKGVDTGCFNSTREFAALINLCDVVVTGDSLALHIGLALQKRMAVLLGPTSATEIDLYDMGEKISAELDCLCCYRQSCDKSPNCMQSISVEKVFRAVEKQIGLLSIRKNENPCHRPHIK